MSSSVNQRGGFPTLTLFLSEGVPQEVENKTTGQTVRCEEDPDNDGCWVVCGIKSNGTEYDVFIRPDYRKTGAGGWAVEVQRQSDYSTYTPSDKTLTVVRRFKIKPKTAKSS